MNNHIMLSICIPTYNHEKYIRQALESVFMQKTKYSYEILVGEDKSTDSTAKILKEIETENHPELKVIYREKNTYKSIMHNARDLRERARGKYLIMLEGDDYWTDEYKVEKQISFLESHPDYIAVAHNCKMVDYDSLPIDRCYKECKDENYTFEHYASDILPGQLATVMMRNYKYIQEFDASFINALCSPGDRKIYFSLLNYGKIYCIQECMSAYRYVDTHGSSWTATHKFDYYEWKKWYLQQLKYAKKHGNEKAIKFADYMLLLSIRQGLVCNKSIGVRVFFKELQNVDNILRSLGLLIKRDFARYCLRKKLYF